MLYLVYVYAQSSSDASNALFIQNKWSAASADMPRPTQHHRSSTSLSSLWSHVEPLDEARRGETALRGLQWGNKVLGKQTVQHKDSASKFNQSVAQSLHGVGWWLAESNCTHVQVLKSSQMEALRRERVRNVHKRKSRKEEKPMKMRAWVFMERFSTIKNIAAGL